MADSTLNAFVLQVADAAALAAVVPSPPTPSSGPDAGYFALQRDTGASWSWDNASMAWIPVGGAGGGLPATVQGDTLYASGVNTIAALAKDTNATRYISNQGASNNTSWNQVNLANGVTGDLPFANLTQGSALSVLGVTGNATADNASIAAGTDGFVLRRSGTSVAFGTLTAGAFPSTIPAILRSTTVLTDAQVKALPTTPITLVAAPGAGFRINVLQVTLTAVFAAGVYTNINAAGWLAVTNGIGGFSYIPNDAGGTPALTQFTDLLGAANKVCVLLPWQVTNDPTLNWGLIASITGTIGTGDNTAIAIEMDNGGSGALTGGNAANTLTVRILYTVDPYP